MFHSQHLAIELNILFEFLVKYMYIQRFGSLLRGGALCMKTFWFQYQLYRKQDCNLLKVETIKGQPKRNLLRIWLCVRTCQNGNATPKLSTEV